MLKKYFINDAANAVGLSIEGLKYYESLGLVSPTRLNNGYRMYSHADIARISTCKMLHSFGINNKNIYEYIHNNDVNEKLDIINQTYENLEKEIFIKKKALEVMHHKKNILENFNNVFNSFKLVYRSEMYIIDFGDDKNIKGNTYKLELIKKLYTHMPLVENITFMTLPINNNTYPSLGFRLDMETANFLGILDSPHLSLIPAGEYLYTVQKIPRHQKHFPFEENILNYVHKHNYTIKYPMEITYLTTINENDDLYDIYEYYITIE